MDFSDETPPQFDVGGYFAPPLSSQLVAPQTGFYYVSGTVEVLVENGGLPYPLRLFLRRSDGALLDESVVTVPEAVVLFTLHVGTLVQLNAGQYVEFVIDNTAGDVPVTLNTVPTAAPIASIHLVGT